MTDRAESKNDRGERIDPRTGAVIARIVAPSDTQPCDGEPDDRGRHAEECACGGTGSVLIRRPRQRAVDPKDDSLTAMFEALAPDDEDGARGSVIIDDAFLQPDITRAPGGGGSGGNKKRKKVVGDRRSAIDGRIEYDKETRARRGRPPKLGETRTARAKTALARSTVNILSANESIAEDHLAEIIETVLQNPDAAMLLAEAREGVGG